MIVTGNKRFPEDAKNGTFFPASSETAKPILGADKMEKTRHNIGTTPLSIGQAAEHLGISRGLLYKLLDEKAIRSFHIGKRRRLISIEAINDFIKKQEERENDVQ